MNRAALVRGIQLIVLITMATFAFLIWRGIYSQKQSLAAGLAHVRPGYLVLAAVLALQEGVCGGLRIFVLGRVMAPKLTVRNAIASEFVLMFVAGVTPGQLGAPVAQVAVLVNGGMKLAEVATAELVTAFCTILFFLLTATLILVLRAKHLFVITAAAQLDWLVGFSVLVFGSCMIGLVLCALQPRLLKAFVRAASFVLAPLWHGAIGLIARVRRFERVSAHAVAQRGMPKSKLLASVDQVHEGFLVYMRRGKLAVVGAFLLTFGFFCSRFAVAYFILLGLGIPTTPNSFVAHGPPIFQVVLVQAMLNFALYLSPTPGASGIAEAGSNTLMSPWVRGPYELPYLVLWRLLALFLCMFVGGTYVFRYLGTDVLEERVKEAEEAEREALEELRVRSERDGQG